MHKMIVTDGRHVCWHRTHRLIEFHIHLITANNIVVFGAKFTDERRPLWWQSEKLALSFIVARVDTMLKVGGPRNERLLLLAKHRL